MKYSAAIVGIGNFPDYGVSFFLLVNLSLSERNNEQSEQQFEQQQQHDYLIEDMLLLCFGNLINSIITAPLTTATCCLMMITCNTALIVAGDNQPMPTMTSQDYDDDRYD